MYTRFWTKSGSEYLINHDERVWQRGYNPDSTRVRTSNGTYVSISEIAVGEPVVMVCPPIARGATGRIIATTEVERVETC